MTNIKNGDIFITRYHDEEKNGFPGYWNHACIYNDGMIIEALMEIGVHTIPFEEWVKGVDRYIQLRYKGKEKKAQVAGKHALTMIGLPYRMVTSVFVFLTPWRIKKGVNCISVVRLAYKKAFKEDPGWVKADDILEDEMFNKILD